MGPGLDIEVVCRGHELALGGRLDVHTSPAARAALHSALDDGVGDLVVRVDRLEIWDAPGLGVLVGAQRRAVKNGRRVVLTGVAPREARLIKATRLHRVLTLDPDPAVLG